MKRLISFKENFQEISWQIRFLVAPYWRFFILHWPQPIKDLVIRLHHWYWRMAKPDFVPAYQLQKYM